MNNFLKECAQAYYSRDKSKISRHLFVFPNRRALVFFKKHLSTTNQGTLISPGLTTISELFSDISDIVSADKLELILSLYKTYKKINSQHESFDEFYYWGDTLINDFDDIDKYLIDTKSIFKNINDLKELSGDFDFLNEDQRAAIESFWNIYLKTSPTDKNRVSFESIWSIMPNLYKEFKENLFLERRAYDGAIQREAIEILKSQHSNHKSFQNFDTVVFIGFNALTSCEKQLFKILKDDGKAEFCWDVEGDFLNDSENNSSFFMRDKSENNLKLFPQSIKLNSVESKPEINIIGVPSEIAMASIASEILCKDLKGSGDINTAVVLPDESLLLPILHTLPSTSETINITMGFPLAGNSISALLEGLIELQNSKFHHSKVLPLLRNQFLYRLSPQSATSLIEEIIDNNLIYCTENIFKKDSIFETIFRTVTSKDLSDEQNIELICRYLIDVLNKISELEEIEEFEMILIETYINLLQKLINLHLPVKKATFLRIFKKVESTTKVPFKGEPLSGLQVMGILETRALDFENIIILSANEGTFPATSSNISFIPANLRHGFGLPGIKHRDSLATYNFYRFITRAKRVYLIYDSRSEGVNAKEKSRFIRQLSLLYKDKLNLKLDEKLVTYKIDSTKNGSISINKDESLQKLIFQKLFSETSKPLSASSLNTFLDCKLKFYFKYILGINEESEVEESVSAALFGNIFHYVVDRIFKTYEGKEVGHSILNELYKNREKIINPIIDEAFLKEFKVKEIKGDRLIVKELVLRYVTELITYELTQEPFVYYKGEYSFNTEKPLVTGQGINYKLKAIIDRIDNCNGRIRIIDYKTGKESKYTDKETIQTFFTPNRPKKGNIWMQLYMYSYLYSLKADLKTNIIVSPYVLTNLFKAKMMSKEHTYDEIKEIKSYIDNIIDDIANPSIPFSQVSVEKIEDLCKYCEFKNICNRRSVND